MKAAAYIHSISKKPEQIQKQIINIKTLCVAQGYELSEVFMDFGLSGTSMDRPSLKTLFERIREGGFNFLVVDSIGALTRSFDDFLDILDILEEHKVILLVAQEALKHIMRRRRI